MTEQRQNRSWEMSGISDEGWTEALLIEMLVAIEVALLREENRVILKNVRRVE
jgi:hypothetical protein